jgi:hypothetical protein
MPIYSVCNVRIVCKNGKLHTKKTNKKISGVRQLNVVIKPSNTRIVLLL